MGAFDFNDHEEQLKTRDCDDTNHNPLYFTGACLCLWWRLCKKKNIIRRGLLSVVNRQFDPTEFIPYHQSSSAVKFCFENVYLKK